MRRTPIDYDHPTAKNIREKYGNIPDRTYAAVVNNATPDEVKRSFKSIAVPQPQTIYLAIKLAEKYQREHLIPTLLEKLEEVTKLSKERSLRSYERSTLYRRLEFRFCDSDYPFSGLWFETEKTGELKLSLRIVTELQFPFFKDYLSPLGIHVDPSSVSHTYSLKEQSLDLILKHLNLTLMALKDLVIALNKDPSLIENAMPRIFEMCIASLNDFKTNYPEENYLIRTQAYQPKNNYPANYEHYLLYKSIVEHDVPFVEALLKRGVDPNIPYYNIPMIKCALYHATNTIKNDPLTGAKRVIDTVKWLLSYGADTTAEKDHIGDSALEYLVRYHDINGKNENISLVQSVYQQLIKLVIATEKQIKILVHPSLLTHPLGQLMAYGNQRIIKRYSAPPSMYLPQRVDDHTLLVPFNKNPLQVVTKTNHTLSDQELLALFDLFCEDFQFDAQTPSDQKIKCFACIIAAHHETTTIDLVYHHGRLVGYNITEMIPTDFGSIYFVKVTHAKPELMAYPGLMKLLSLWRGFFHQYTSGKPVFTFYEAASLNGYLAAKAFRFFPKYQSEELQKRMEMILAQVYGSGEKVLLQNGRYYLEDMVLVNAKPKPVKDGWFERADLESELYQKIALPFYSLLVMFENSAENLQAFAQEMARYLIQSKFIEAAMRLRQSDVRVSNTISEPQPITKHDNVLLFPNKPKRIKNISNTKKRLLECYENTTASMPSKLGRYQSRL